MSKRYYLDTEFLDDGQRLVLISIALVCDDGRELYLVSNEFDYDEVRSDDWMRENVLAKLPPSHGAPLPPVPMTHNSNVYYCPPLPPSPMWRTRDQIRDAIAEFIVDEGNGVRPEIWAYFASYDWVLFCQLFGKMINLPKHFPWLVNDLKTWATHMGYVGKFRELLPDTGHHDALCDARWNRDVHKLLTEKLATVPSMLPSIDEVTRGLGTLRDICEAMVVQPPPPEKVDEIQNVLHCMTRLMELVLNPRN